jgi:hypothetical protein
MFDPKNKASLSRRIQQRANGVPSIVADIFLLSQGAGLRP